MEGDEVLNELPGIKDTLAPDYIASLQSFSGLANYYQIFKKDKHWEWTAECQEAFEKIKKTLTSDLFLTHYNPDLEIIVASDASSYGVGACILHKMTHGRLKSIAHASSALLPAEKKLFAN